MLSINNGQTLGREHAQSVGKSSWVPLSRGSANASVPIFSVQREICFSHLVLPSPASHGSYLGRINSRRQEWEERDEVN